MEDFSYKKKICEYYESDNELSLLDVANKFQIDRDTASRVLKRNGVSVRKITTNAMNKYKRILIYDLNGDFLRADLLKEFVKWLNDNGYTTDTSGRSVAKCLAGELRQAHGFVLRWHKESYPTKIKLEDYWDKSGNPQFKKELVPRSVKKPTRSASNSKILVYNSKNGEFLKEIGFIQAIDELVQQGFSMEKAKRNIWGVLGGHKKSFNGFVYRHYKEFYPNIIDITPNWRNDYDRHIGDILQSYI